MKRKIGGGGSNIPAEGITGIPNGDGISPDPTDVIRREDPSDI